LSETVKEDDFLERITAQEKILQVVLQAAVLAYKDRILQSAGGQPGCERQATGAEDAHYGRWPYLAIPTIMPAMPHNWYVTAQKLR